MSLLKVSKNFTQEGREMEKPKDRNAGVALGIISTQGLDGIPPQYERRGNLIRKPYNENYYDSYKKGDIYGR